MISAGQATPPSFSNWKRSAGVKIASIVCSLTLTLVTTSCAPVSAPSPNSQPASPAITVRILPGNAEVQSGSSFQLTATLSGTGNTAVKWSATKGSISGAGLFQAPSVTSTTAVTVTAVSVAGPTPAAVTTASGAEPTFGPSGGQPRIASGSATITILPAASQPRLAITPKSLPPATVGVSYSVAVAASGGTQPYTWNSLSSGLPPGLAVDPASGAITGMPDQPGTYSFQLQVTDSLSHTAKWASTMGVSAGQSSSNHDGPAELPRVYLQTAMANTPARGTTTLVSAGGDFQSALNNAQCGDTIELQAGATFSGLFKVPAKACDDDHWIVVRTSASDASLPPEGGRVSPCFAGVTSLPGRPSFHCSSPKNVLAKILFTQTSGSGPIQFESGANHYRFLGLEITRSTGTGYVGSLVMPQLWAAADHLIIDRSWLHGSAQDETDTGVALSGITNAAVIDSYLTDFHCTSVVGSCTDAHAIAGGGGSLTGGPYQITNNFLEASGESILFGGGAATTAPADIQIAQNHFFKPWIWMSGTSGYVGGVGGNPFLVKNHLELKNAQRVLVEGNIFENDWGGFSQIGFSILLTPKNQYVISSKTNVCPLCKVTDVTIRNCTISHVGAGIQIADVPSDGGAPALAGEHYSIHDVIIDDISAKKYNGGGGFIEFGNGWTANVLNSVTVNHVTAFPDPVAHILSMFNATTNPTMFGFNFTNNIVNATKFPVWNGSGNPQSCSFFDVPLTTMTACFTTFSFLNNVIAATPSAYPPSDWPAKNFFPTDDSAIQFVNYNNASGGDYHLLPSSPYKNAGSDGKDPGADIDAVQAAIAGVY
jgi:hypothetical protein